MGWVVIAHFLALFLLVDNLNKNGHQSRLMELFIFLVSNGGNKNFFSSFNLLVVTFSLSVNYSFKEKQCNRCQDSFSYSLSELAFHCPA